MKYAFFAACGALTLASTMTLSAQTPAPTQPAMTVDHNSITVTGCLKPWDNTMGMAPADPMAKPGDPIAKPGATPMAVTRYVLGNVVHDKAAGPPQSATPTAGTPSPAHPQASQYVVMAGSGVNLAAHLNHQVRLVGTVHGGMASADKPSDKPMARPGDPAPAPGMAAGHMAGDTKWATLTATSVTMISTTCTTTVQ